MAQSPISTSRRYDTQIHRRVTRTVNVGGVLIGSDHPVRVQSMINEDTLDVEGSTAGIRRLHEVGCEIVRLTVPTLASAKAVGEIKKLLSSTYQPVPLVADVLHNGMKIALEVAKHVDKVRINPGLFVFERPDPNRTEFTNDEINIIKKGENYGWPMASYGINYIGTKFTDKTSIAGMEDPIHYWVPSIAPSGMAFITSDRYPNYKGNLLIGSLLFEYVHMCIMKDNRVYNEEIILEDIGRVRSIREGPDGYMLSLIHI